MVIPVEDPTYVYGDNQYVLDNTTMPESTLKKNSNSIVFHFLRWKEMNGGRPTSIRTLMLQT